MSGPSSKELYLGITSLKSSSVFFSRGKTSWRLWRVWETSLVVEQTGVATVQSLVIWRMTAMPNRELRAGKAEVGKVLMAVLYAAAQIIGRMSALRRGVRETKIEGLTEEEDPVLTLAGVEDREILEELGEGIMGVVEVQLG